MKGHVTQGRAQPKGRARDRDRATGIDNKANAPARGTAGEPSQLARLKQRLKWQRKLVDIVLDDEDGAISRW